MYRIVFCVKLKNIYLGLNKLPLTNNLGIFVFKKICKKFWLKWLKKQTILINENNLNFLKKNNIKYLINEIKYLFNYKFLL